MKLVKYAFKLYDAEKSIFIIYLVYVCPNILKSKNLEYSDSEFKADV